MRLGLVTNILNEEYQISVFNGIKKRTQELGIELVCFQNETFNLERTPFFCNFYKKEFFNLDGIILLTSALNDTSKIKCKEDIVKLWGNIPVISIGQKIDKVPSLLTQTDDSMKQLVEHLVVEHKYRKFIFIGGTENHYDAIKRKDIFIKSMEMYKSNFPEIEYLIERGHFEERPGLFAIKRCYSQHPDFIPDAIVCANDSMAVGVNKFLKMNKGNSKIYECAVTGFDDIPRSRFMIPSLTTIHQPLSEIADTAVDLIVKLIKEFSLPDENYIESKLIIRNSCGCKKQTNESDFVDEMQKSYINSEEMLRMVSTIGQELNFAQNYKDLCKVMEENTEQLEISNCCILKNGKKNDCIKPVYVRRNGKNLSAFTNKEITLGDFYKQYIEMDSQKPKTLVVKFLNAGNEIKGCFLYDANEVALQYLVSVSVDIAQSLDRIEMTEERKKRSEYLEKEVNKRTQQLLESNNKRMEVEAEVLKISELERQRFSTDLHDDICQRLAGISMLCRSFSRKNSVGKEQMDELTTLISDTLQTTRQYAHNSYPVELESLGMNHSISNLCNSFETQSGIKCTYDWQLDETVQFTKIQKLNIFRIIQEALHNAMKHSHAQNVFVVVKKNEKYVIVQIIDDGQGFTKSNIDTNGIGINSMQYRANQIGAKFSIKQNNPTGICVEIKVGDNEKQN